MNTDPSESEIEAVAEAFWGDSGLPWTELDPEMQEEYRDSARAALVALDKVRSCNQDGVGGQ